ncbi:hypothetical protein MMC18_000718 [Xylographa bjoerkii]|nr:hypothetical protein [Xylographa bjoerkii]
MAEVLGVVASGISIAGLAIQITTSIQQILDFWSSIKGAPTEIQNLLEELDLLAEILSTVDDNSDNDENPPRQAAAVKATRYCQNAASCIDAVVKDLSKGFEMPRGRRHWTAVKAVLKDKTMSKSLQRLERAKTMLSLAQQCYTQAQIRALEEFQRQKFQAIENLLTVPASQYTITTIASRQGSTSKSANAAVTSSINRTHIRDKRTENVTYWLPLGTLTVRSKPSGQGQVDTNEGDVKTSDGWTLLHVAAAFADAKLCQWLIGQGLDGTASAKLEGPYRMGDRTMPLILQIFEMGSYVISFNLATVFGHLS